MLTMNCLYNAITHNNRSTTGIPWKNMRCINGRMLWPWAATAIQAGPDFARNEAQSAFSALLCVILQSHMTFLYDQQICVFHCLPLTVQSLIVLHYFFLVPKGIEDVSKASSDSHETCFERRASPETARPCSEVVQWSEFSQRCWSDNKKDARLQKVDFVQPKSDVWRKNGDIAWTCMS